MKVYFENSQGVEREIGECSTQEEGCKIIMDFLKERNYTMYYQRSWETENGIHYDVGSHTEFFRIGLEENK